MTKQIKTETKNGMAVKSADAPRAVEIIHNYFAPLVTALALAIWAIAALLTRSIDIFWLVLGFIPLFLLVFGVMHYSVDQLIRYYEEPKNDG